MVAVISTETVAREPFTENVAPACEENESWLLLSSRIPPYALIAINITLARIKTTVSGTRRAGCQSYHLYELRLFS